MANFVEHYELTERIKQVNGASWWRGWDGKLERDVSIWTLPIADPRVLKLQASASAAANLQDPRVLRVLDIVKNQTHFAVISEWVQGVTVAELVLGRAPLKDAVEIVSSVIECLSSAHAQQVFHGAVGADDVIITNAGIKIRGFGIAGVLTESFGITAEAADIAAVGGNWLCRCYCNLAVINCKHTSCSAKRERSCGAAIAVNPKTCSVMG